MATIPVWENRLPLAAARNRLNGKTPCRILASPIRKTMSPSRSTARPHWSHRVIAGVITIEGSRPSARARVAAGPQGLPCQPGGANRSERSRTSWAWAPKRIDPAHDPEHGRPRDGDAWGRPSFSQAVRGGDATIAAATVGALRGMGRQCPGTGQVLRVGRRPCAFIEWNVKRPAWGFASTRTRA